MVIAVILAGGVGARMNAIIPKQFIKVLGKPIIVYTLEVFESNPQIDAIEVVTVADYINEVKEYKNQYNISKLKWVVKGGETCQDSINHGILALENICSEDDIVMLAMSVCPLITDDIIFDSLRICNQYGNAIAAANSIFNFSTLQDGYWAENYILKGKINGYNIYK